MQIVVRHQFSFCILRLEVLGTISIDLGHYQTQNIFGPSTVDDFDVVRVKTA